MIATFHSLVSELLPAWLFAAGQPARPVKAKRVAPAPNTEAEAAAWLLSRERQYH